MCPSAQRLSEMGKSKKKKEKKGGHKSSTSACLIDSLTSPPYTRQRQQTLD